MSLILDPSIKDRNPKCKYCGVEHSRIVNCERSDLKAAILGIRKVLKEGFDSYQELLKTNEEIVGTANGYRRLASQTAKAIAIIEATIKEEIGGQSIWERCESAMEKLWVSQPSSQNTEQPNSNESTIQSEEKSKQCIEETPSGETTEQSSLQ